MVDLSDHLELFITLTIVVTLGVGMVGGGLFATDNTGQEAIEPTVGDAELISETIDEAPGGLSIQLTTANALYLDGGGSYVKDPTNASVFADGGWTVAMVAEPSREGALGPNDTATLYAAENETAHLLLEEGNWTARYESGTASAYVEAPADLDGRTPVAASYNTSSGELELYVDGTLADSAPLTATTEPRNPAYSWVGSLDEVRVWNASLAPSAHASYASAPVAPLPANASARLMFNEGEQTTAYYADGDATIVGETELVDGVAGPDLVAGEDYSLAFGPFTLTAIAGGAVDGAPVVFVSYSDGGLIGSIVGILPVLLFLIPLVVLANRVTDAL